MTGRGSSAPVHSISIPEYVRGEKPDYLAVGRQLDRVIGAHFQGDIAIRGITIADHPGLTLDDLVATILELGTDRYDPERKAVLHERYDPHGVELHVLPCTVVEGKLQSPHIDPRATYVMEDVVGVFYEGPPFDRNGPPIRLDVLTIYDPHQLEHIRFVVSDENSGEGGERDGGFRFKHPNRKRDALLGIVKIL